MKPFRQLLREAIDVTDNPNFWKWFGESKVVNERGNPLVMYHATLTNVSEFKTNSKGLIFVTPSTNWAGVFISGDAGNTKSGHTNDGAVIMPLYVSASNPFDFENKKHVSAIAIRASLGPQAIKEVKKGNWQRIEDRTVLEAIKFLGFDGLYINEGKEKNLAVFSPTQIKSATGNNGNFDPNDPDITH